MGLNGAGSSAYDAILTAAVEDDVIGQSFLDIMDGDTLQTQVAQMLPDHAGGLFAGATRALRLVAQHDLAAFWRTGGDGPLFAFARAGAARMSFSSTRALTVTANDTDYSYASAGDWKGWLFSGMGGVSYDIAASRQLMIQPKARLEWYRLKEGGYTESGGGDAVDLTVDARNSSSLSGTTSLAVSYAFAPRHRDYRPLTLEVEAGRRTVLSGKLGVTQAHFADGDPFSITPDPLDDAWTGELRLLAGGWDYTWKLAAGAEKSPNSSVDYSARVSLSVAF